MVRVERIELSLQPWEGHVLPLNYTRVFAAYLDYVANPNC